MTSKLKHPCVFGLGRIVERAIKESILALKRQNLTTLRLLFIKLLSFKERI
jgi:hypothetical protein